MNKRTHITESLESDKISAEGAVARLEGSTGQRKPDRTKTGLPASVRRLWQATSWSGVALALANGQTGRAVMDPSLRS